ncbi:MAG: protein containing BNR/Asp-box repeat [Candidatus Aminicenantes bacterium]|nr:protein containing BNR/Asp-box repeat [Candidatus Aminicenantes bacterium]
MRKGRFVICSLVLGLALAMLDANAYWTAAKRLTWTSGDSYNSAVAIDSNDAIHVVWNDDSSGNDEIYYKSSKDGGTTWSYNKRLSWTSGFSYNWHPKIAIDASDVIHIVWRASRPDHTDIYYRRSQDGGTNWSTTKRLTWTSGFSASPDIAIGSGDAVRVVWHDDVVWTDGTPGNAEIYYKGSDDGGTTWTTARRLTWTADSSYSPAIALDSGGSVQVVWYDDTPGNYEIYHKRSTDGGTSWTAAKRLTWTADASEEPDMAIDSGDIISVAWDDDTPGLSEIYYKRSTDGGTTWTSSKRLTWTSGWSGYPAMATDSTDTVHVVWEDDTSGNYEIYYKKGT